MEVEWFLKIADKEVGPLSARQLKAMALRGEISKFDAVRRGSDGRWVPASSVKGLLPTGASAAEGRRPNRTPAARQPEQPPAAPQTPPGAKTQPGPAPAAEPPGPVPSAIPRAIPVAQPVVARPDASGVQPARLGEFNIDTSVDIAASSVADRRSVTPTDSTRRRRNNLVVVVVAVSVVALAAVGAGVLLSRKGPGTASEDAYAASDKAGAHSEQEREPVVIRGLDEYLGEAGPKAPEEDEADAAPGEWTNASTSSAECGDVTVKIASAQIGRPRLISVSSGTAARPRTDCLWLKIEVRNTNKTTKLEYTSWNVGQKGVRLVDNDGKEYSVKSFASHGLEIEGQIEGGRGSLLPEEATEDVLAFDRPDRSAKSLRLELPSAAFGETGTLKFEIPAAMIAWPAESEGQTEPDAASKLADGHARPEAGKAPRVGEGADGGPIAIPGVSYEANDDEDAFSFANVPKLQKAREELRRQRAEELRQEEEEEKDKEREDARGARKRRRK